MRLFLVALLICIASLGFTQMTYIETDNITYTSASGQPQQLDQFVPFHQKGQPAMPGIIFVHGGGWVSGEKEDFKSWGQYYAGLGYVCVSINYRMIPNQWPAEIDDPQAAVRWMRKNASSLNLNPNLIGAVGASAGGHLVLFLGETDTLHDFDPTLHGYSSKVQAVADFYGPTDFNNPSEWSPSIWELILELVGPAALGNFVIASPINYCTAADSPTVVFQGDADPTVPVNQSREIVARKQALGSDVNYYEFPGEGHGFNGTDTWTCILIINSFFGSLLNPPKHL
jgi:acetyl esterase/lipase